MASSVCPLPSPGLGSSFVHFEKFGDRSARRAQRRGMGVRRGSSVSRFMQGPWECPPSLEGCPKGQDTATGDGRPEPSGPPAPCQQAARNSPPSTASGSPLAPSTAGSPRSPLYGTLRTPPDWGSLAYSQPFGAPCGSPTSSGLLAETPPDRGSPRTPPIRGALRTPTRCGDASVSLGGP